MPGSLVKLSQVITLAGRPGEWTKRETGQRVTHRSCALLPRLMWSGPYCELYSHAVCTWKLWNYFPLSWFLYERIRFNLINPRVLKIERGVHEKKLDSAPFTVGPRKNATCLEVILLNKILRNHLLSENMQWNYASINVTLNYLLHEIREFCVLTSSLALDNWEQKYCQILGNKPNYSLRVPPERLFSTRENVNYFKTVCFTQCTLFFQKVCFLLPICLPCAICGSYETKISAVLVRQRPAVIRVAWLGYLVCLRSHVLRAYCNFESKQANSITLFGRHPNNKQLTFVTTVCFNGCQTSNVWRQNMACLAPY